MSGVDDVEYANLAEQVRRIELLVDADTRGDSNYLLKSFLQNAKSRMNEILPDGVRAEDEKKERKAMEVASIAQLVEMEHKLSAQEKQQYSGFLKLDYFTKANFDELEKFYADGGAWDKLSESGKAQMSHRVWEGIRRDEYDFDELPEDLRKKESERLYQQLTGQIQADPNLQNIPQQDRAEFIRAHETGDEKSESKILGRKSFSMNVSTTSSTEVSLRETSVSSKKEVDEPNPKIAPQEQLKATADVTLAGISMEDAAGSPMPPLSGSVASGLTGRG